MRANGFSRTLPFIILVAGVGGMLGLKNLKQDPPSKDAVSRVPSVSTVEAKPCNEGFKIHVDGVVVPFREVTLASRVSGQILTKSPQARAGEFVRKGEVLFEIDPSDLELEVRRLKESLKQAGSSIEESDVEKTSVEELVALAEEQRDLQRKAVARFEELRTRNATSESKFEAARADEIRSLNSLQTLKNQITMLNARRNRLLQERERATTMLDQAILNLSRTQITAPSDGIVMEDMAEQDDFVQVGTPLVRIEDTSEAEVRFALRMDQLRWLWSSDIDSVAASSTGQRDSARREGAARDSYYLPKLSVRIHVDIEGNHFYWPARLERYDGAGINASTRTIPVIASVKDPRGVQAAGRDSDALPLPGPPTLMRNTFVTVEIPITNQLDLVSIPPEALRPGERVWVLDDGKLRVRKVKVAQSSEEEIILLANPKSLTTGDQIIVSPLPVVVDGMELRRASVAKKSAAVVAAGASSSDQSM